MTRFEEVLLFLLLCTIATILLSGSYLIVSKIVENWSAISAALSEFTVAGRILVIALVFMIVLVIPLWIIDAARRC